jgi:hypothetical protein
MNYQDYSVSQLEMVTWLTPSRPAISDWHKHSVNSGLEHELLHAILDESIIRRRKYGLEWT